MFFGICFELAETIAQYPFRQWRTLIKSAILNVQTSFCCCFVLFGIKERCKKLLFSIDPSLKWRCKYPCALVCSGRDRDHEGESGLKNDAQFINTIYTDPALFYSSELRVDASAPLPVFGSVKFYCLSWCNLSPIPLPSLFFASLLWFKFFLDSVFDFNLP